MKAAISIPPPSTAAAEFGCFLKYLLATKGVRGDAVLLAEQHRAPDRVLRLLKAAGEAASTTTEGFTALIDYRVAANSFIESLGVVGGVFDRLLADRAVRRTPLKTRIHVVTATVVGSAAVEEGALKPVSELALAGGQLEPRKAAAFLVVTSELARLMTGAAEGLISSELRNAVANATDESFLTGITAGAPSNVSLGTDTDGLSADLQWLLGEVSLGQASKPYLITNTERATALATTFGTSGPTFPTMSPNGGTLAGIPVLVSDSVDGMVLIDAASIAADAGTIVLDVAKSALLDLGAGSLVSLFQSGHVGLRAERDFGFELLRADAVAQISGESA